MLKVLAFVCGVLLLILVGGLVGTRYFFPEDLVRRQLEQVLSEQLQGNVRVASLKWDLFAGIRLGPVEIERNGVRFAEFDDLALHYNLWPLLHGEIVIEELALRHASVFIGLEALAPATLAEPPPEPSTKNAFPSLPLAIDLESISILDSEVVVTRDDGFRLALHHVNLSAGLSAGPSKVAVSGTLDVVDLEIALVGKQRQLPLHTHFAVTVDLPGEQLVVERLEMRSDPVIRLSVTGRIDHVVSTREMTFSVQEAWIDLEQLLRFGRPLLPPHLTDIQLAGTISPRVTIKGSQTEEGFDGIVDAVLRGVDVQGTFPVFQIALEPTSFQMNTGELLIRGNRPQTIRADLSLDSTFVSAGTTAVRNLTMGVQAIHEESGELSAHLTVTGGLSAALPSPLQPISEPVELEIDLSGDQIARSVLLRKAKVQVGTLLELDASAGVGPMKEDLPERPFAAKAVIQSNVTKLLPTLHDTAIGAVALSSERGLQKLELNLTGALDPEFRPRRASADASLEMVGLHAASAESDISGTLERLAVEMQATYGAKTGSLMGTLSGVMGLEELKQSASLVFGTASLKFNGKLTGHVTPEMGVSRLMVSHRLELETSRIRYLGPDMTGQLDRMTVSSEIEADLTEGAYHLNSMRIAADDFLDCTIKGVFRSKGQQFSVDLSMPMFDVAKIQTHIAGPDMQALAEVTPSGRLSLQVRGSGTVPKAAQIAELQIPVTAFLNLELHDVAVAFQDHTVTGANGTVRISVEPKERHQIASSLQFQAKRIGVGGGLPIKELKKLSIDLVMSAEDFDNLALERLVIGTEGAEVTLDGEVSGVKRLLTRKNVPFSALFGPLFVKMRSNANLDIDQFGEVVQSYGLVGSGHAGFGLSLLKREQGALDVRLRLFPQRLSLTKAANHIEELDGAIEVRKVLEWIPALDGSSPDTLFSPTGVLPDLRTSFPSRQDIRIQRIETGVVQVQDFSGSLFFDRNRFVLQDFAMTVLGGGLGGEVVLTGGKGFGLNTRLEVAAVDVNRLLSLGEQIQGDSLIDGTLTVMVAFDEKSGRLDFGRSKLDLSLSRIGRDTLDRVLRFLDPKGSNPSIVGARSSVKLANPSSARVTLSKGLVGLQILFQEGLLAKFEMNRIPVSQIKQVQDLTQAIPQWEMIRRAMEVLGAGRYGVDEAGAFVLE